MQSFEAISIKLKKGPGFIPDPLEYYFNNSKDRHNNKNQRNNCRDQQRDSNKGLLFCNRIQRLFDPHYRYFLILCYRSYNHLLLFLVEVRHL
jgi:hypothetical protein